MKKSISKQLWKFQEALLYLAAQNVSKNNQNIKWGFSINGIDTDISIFSNDLPELVFQVRHSGSQKNQETKFWREVHEIIAIKNVNPNCKCVGILFDSKSIIGHSTIKKGLEDCEEALFDANISIEKYQEGTNAIKTINKLTEDNIAIPAEECLKILKQYIEKNSNSPVVMILNEIEIEIKKLLKNNSTKNSNLWHLANTILNRKTNYKLDKFSNTSLKKAIAKILLLDDEDLNSLLNNENSGNLELCKSEHCDYIGISTVSRSLKDPIGKRRICDHDIVELFKRFSKEEIKYIINEAPQSSIKSKYVEDIKLLSNNPVVLKAFIVNLSKFTNRNALKKVISDCFDDPQQSTRVLGISEYTSRCWPIDYTMLLARYASGLNQGYGYPELAIDCNEPDFNNFPGLTISAYRTGSKKPSEKHLSSLAAGLAHRISKLVDIKFPAAELLGPEAAIQILETALIPYRELDPVGSLLKLHYGHKKMLTREMVPRHKTVISEIANLGSATTKATIFHQNKEVVSIVLYQSPNKNPRDKMKEFCGRAMALRIMKEQTNFKIRYPKAKFIFIADGSWQISQLKELIKFGFDEVISPAELKTQNLLL